MTPVLRQGRGLIIPALFATALFFCPASAQAQVKTRSVSVSASPIVSFDLNDSGRTRFGSLEFVGGLAMYSDPRDFGALSGLRLRDASRMVAVTDTGFWVSGNINRDQSGKPVSLSAVQMAPMLNERGEAFSDKWEIDAESVTFDGNTAFVGTEQDTRIMRFAEGALLETRAERLTPFFPEGEFSYNNGFEALATFPENLGFSGGLLVLRERRRKEAEKGTPIPGYIVFDQKLQPLSVADRDGFSITDADFLPDGDLVILERLFSVSRGIKLRIRRIAGSDVKPGAVLDGKVIFQADRNQQVDNMEGLSVFRHPDGSTRLAMISDNNHWLLQRNLYLEFKLAE